MKTTTVATNPMDQARIQSFGYAVFDHAKPDKLVGDTLPQHSNYNKLLKKIAKVNNFSSSLCILMYILVKRSRIQISNCK